MDTTKKTTNLITKASRHALRVALTFTKMVEKIERNLSGMFFRAKVGEKWDNVCFEDLPESEQDRILKKSNPEFVRGIVKGLARTINEIGEHTGIAKD